MTQDIVMFRRTLICLALLGLAGCAAMDPYQRQGDWRPNNANDDNLRVMVVSPSDLVRGVGSQGGDGQQAAAALDRLRNDKVRRLPDSDIAKVTTVSNGGSQGGP